MLPRYSFTKRTIRNILRRSSRKTIGYNSSTGKKLGAQMVIKKRRGNPRWAENMLKSLLPTISEFERVAARLRLEPDEYVDSQELRAWAEKNKDARFVPEQLLKAWGIPLRRTFEDCG
jgi:hypothetical protein